MTALAVTELQGQRVIVSGSSDGSIRIWDLERGEAVGEPLAGHTSSVTLLVIAERQGRKVIVSGSDDKIRIWDLERGEAVGASLAGHTSSVMLLVIAERQGRKMIVSGTDDKIRIWDLESAAALRTIDVGAPVCSIAFTLPSTIVVGTKVGLIAVRLHQL